jgi:8-oxo-dGTP pyrophosphatase MutT (NUDIX family)
MFPHLTEEFIITRLREFNHPTHMEAPFEQFQGRPARFAAVLLPLLRHDDEWHLLFTRRADSVENHKGQVSFPGGGTDPQDTSPEDTALRETEEEIGVQRQHVRLLGRLGQMLTVTNFLVTPVVGVIPWPYTFKIHTPEVGRVFTMPLAWLANKNNYHEFVRQESGRGVVAYYPFDGEMLWGATARMTVNFLAALGL